MGIRQITKEGWYALGGCTNKALFKRDIYLGKHFMYTAYYMHT